MNISIFWDLWQIWFLSSGVFKFVHHVWFAFYVRHFHILVTFASLNFASFFFTTWICFFFLAFIWFYQFVCSAFLYLNIQLICCFPYKKTSFLISFRIYLCITRILCLFSIRSSFIAAFSSHISSLNSSNGPTSPIHPHYSGFHALKSLHTYTQIRVQTYMYIYM